MALAAASDIEPGDDPAALAGRLLEEERRRQAEADPDEPRLLDDDELPGVGEAPMPFREVLRVGGPATVFVLFLLNLVDEFDRFTLLILGPDIQRTFGLSDTGLTALGGAGAIAVFLAAIPLGGLADRKRRTAIVGATAGVLGTMSMLGGLARGVWLLGITRFVGGLGKGNGPVANSLLADRYPIGGRGRIYALYNLANPVGAALGPMLAAGIATVAGGTEGWRWSFVVLGLPTVALAAWAFTLSEPERGANERVALGLDEPDAAPVVASDRVPMTAAFERLRKIKSFAAQMSALAALGFGICGLVGHLLAHARARLRPRVRRPGHGVLGRRPSAASPGMALGGRLADTTFQRDPARVGRLVGVAMVAFGVLFTVSIHMPDGLAARRLPSRRRRSACHAPLAMNSALAGVGRALPRCAARRSPCSASTSCSFGGLVGGIVTAVLSDALGARTALTVVMPIAFAVAGAYMFSAARHVRHDMALVVEELREEQAEAERVREGLASDELLQVRNLDFSYGPGAGALRRRR